jgi:hypothetical protein
MTISRSSQARSGIPPPPVFCKKSLEVVENKALGVRKESQEAAIV